MARLPAVGRNAGHVIAELNLTSHYLSRFFWSIFTPLEIMDRCSGAGLDFRTIPAGFNALLEFLTGFTLLPLQKKELTSKRIYYNKVCEKFNSIVESWK